MGPGDLVPQSLNLVGYEVEEITKSDLNIDKLKNYDALIFGVRTLMLINPLYNTNPVLCNSWNKEEMY